MSERDDFVAALFDAPDDDAVKLVFADWLDEHDEPRAAERLRWWCAERRILRAYMLNKQSPIINPLPALSPGDDYGWRLVSLTACRCFDATAIPWDMFPWPSSWSSQRFLKQFELAQTTIEATLLEVLPWMELTAVREPLYELLERAEYIRDQTRDDDLEYWVKASFVEHSILQLLAVTQDRYAWEFWLENRLNGANEELELRYRRGIVWLFGRAVTAGSPPDSGPA